MPSDPPILTPVKQEITEPRDALPVEAILAELQAAAATAADLAEHSQASSTTRAHEGDWRHFAGWCERHHLCPLPAEPEVVALYIAAHSQAHKASTIRRRLSTLSVAHREAGYDPDDWRESVVVQKTWAGLVRTRGTATDSKSPTRTAELRKMVSTLTLDRLIGIRDRAILVIGFAGAFRRSEVVGFDIAHVREEPDGLVVRLPWSKTNAEGALEEIALPYGSDPLTCPVRAWRDWLDASDIDEGPPFRPIDRHGRMGEQRLSGRAVAEVVKRTARAAGMEADLLAGHSLRSGFITSAADNDVPERDIMNQSRHKSVPVMRNYIHRANLFKNNAAAKVGL
jgi:integrase